MSVGGIVLVSVALLLYLAVFGATFLVTAEMWDSSRLAACAVGLVGGFIVISVPVALISRVAGDGDGVHRWDGGAGPETVCYYAVDDTPIRVGKTLVPHEQLQTVCRNPE